MDRILALPDLAGLSGCQTPSRIHGSSRGTKRPRPYEGWEPSSDGGYSITCSRSVSHIRQKKARQEDEPRIIAVNGQALLEAQASANSFDKSEAAHMSGIEATIGRITSTPSSSWEDSCNLDIARNSHVSYSDFEAGLDTYDSDSSNGFNDHMLSSGKYYFCILGQMLRAHARSSSSIQLIPSYALRIPLLDVSSGRLFCQIPIGVFKVSQRGFAYCD